MISHPNHVVVVGEIAVFRLPTCPGMRCISLANAAVLDDLHPC
jgi:hypothetical protein